MTVFPRHFALVFRMQHTFACTVLLYISTIGYDVNEVKLGSKIFLGRGISRNWHRGGLQSPMMMVSINTCGDQP